ncbi:DUF7346 family protein [Natronosalvus rutilus]|uniref:Uncharacterized protein n=1 Tax=Natronosalvus rutilus TaxID=2953753 RepID=A0A9E7STI3_9EURY|nr:hypothetical protein [Natronosalvus rutilus]UTF53709.1 hypothetical protein NGM29_18410 [Natronosalvus rutilus]
MKPVRGDDGTRYLLVKRSSDSSLVRDPSTGEERYVENDRLEALPEQSALELAARAVDDDVRTLLLSIHDERTLGLVLEIAERGPLGVREILGYSDFCESDLHGRLTVLTAGGVLEETEVGGERGYAISESARRGLDVLVGGTAVDGERPP